MSQVKAAILVGGPLDGKSIEVSVDLTGYLEAVYDVPGQAEFSFDKPAKIDAKPAIRIAIYKEQPDGTHWKYYSG